MGYGLHLLYCRCLLLPRFVSNGQLVPDELMLKTIGGELNRLSSADRSWLLDGFPRTKSQALSLFKIAPVQVVISLDVPFDVIINRVKGQLPIGMLVI